MKRSLWIGSLVVGLAMATSALAADHGDSPAVMTDPTSDLADLFAWMSSDGSKVYLAMTLASPATKDSKFSDKVLYAFHVNSSPGYGQASSGTVNVICGFDAAQKISCWAGDEYVTGDASNTAGLSSSSGKLKVFAGLRNDPFFFNADGFEATAKAVAAAASSLKFDPAGCPTLDAATSKTLVTQLKTGKDGAAPKDFVNNLNVLAIVVAVDKTVVAKNTVLGVWASTNKK